MVNSNKQYFESIASFGQSIEEGINVESPDLEQPFYPTKKDEDQPDGESAPHELDDELVREILIDHLQKEGLKDSVDQMKKEGPSSGTHSNLLEESLLKFKSYQEQFNELKEIVEDLKNKKTESALRWANQNQRQLQANNGSNFIFLLHQVNYRQMLQKAVDIHFELNYKHLCSSPQDINDDEGDESPVKTEQVNGGSKKGPLMQSSLIDDEDPNQNQIDSGKDKDDGIKTQTYQHGDYDATCLQILNYITVNLSHILTGKTAPGQIPSLGASTPQDALALQEEQNKIQKMMGALIFIPKYSEQRLKNSNLKTKS